MRKQILVYVAAIAAAMAARGQEVMPEPHAKYELQSAVGSKDGEQTDSIAYFYDEHHRPMREERWLKNSNTGTWTLKSTTNQKFNNRGCKVAEWTDNYRREWDYDTNCLVTEDRNYTLNEDNGEFELSDSKIYTYNDRGLVTCIEMSFFRNGKFYNGSLNLFEYGDECDLPLKFTLKMRSADNTEWALRREIVYEIARLPFEYYPQLHDISNQVYPDNQYYVAKSTDYDANHEISSTSSIDYKLVGDTLMRTGFSTHPLGEFYNSSDKAKFLLRDVDGKNMLSISYSESDFAGTHYYNEYSYDNLYRQIKSTKRQVISKTGKVSDLISEYGYVENTNQINHFAYSVVDGERPPFSRGFDLVCDMSQPITEVNFYGKDNIEFGGNVDMDGAKLYFKPLTFKSYDSDFGWTTTTYHYNDLTSIADMVVGEGSYDVWPKRVDDMVNITVPAGEQPSVEMYSMTGTRVAFGSQTQMSLGHLAAGIYIVSVNGHPFRIVKN